jgi:hypothetical protein
MTMDDQYEPDEVTAQHLAHLDMVVFHPLDHRPWSRRCRALHGGGRHHLALTWSYEVRPRLLSMVACPLGFHDPIILTWTHGHVETRCVNCQLPRRAWSRWRGDDRG